jgi:hypothetical protein
MIHMGKGPLSGMERAFRESARLEQMLFGEEEKSNENLKEEAKMTAITFKHVETEGVAVVRVNETGQVEVERDGMVTNFNPAYNLKTVVDNFEARGWEQINPSAVVKAAIQQNIPVDVQEEVDEYLKLHEEMAELKAKQEKLKKSIRGFMEDGGLTSIQGSEGKKVYLQDAMASNSTSKYSDYELSHVMTALEGELLRKVTEIRVNTEKLEGLLKIEKLPKEKVEQIRSMKIANPGTPRFSVKK